VQDYLGVLGKEAQVSVCLSCFSEFITLQVRELLKSLQHDVYRPDADGIKALMESTYMFTSTYNGSPSGNVQPFQAVRQSFHYYYYYYYYFRLVVVFQEIMG